LAVVERRKKADLPPAYARRFSLQHAIRFLKEKRGGSAEDPRSGVDRQWTRLMRATYALLQLAHGG
jgi:hypothetical protein